ncbi:hypothetical protein CTA2_3952 [Colletotrichum tanaceti]|uniref:2EXR domain-containing protein n=1 Tax=Colletotrichum tanaceti TaxID=1306861 RepID=A0A4U6XI13_9PEZI|nr:hypothetical protein CTA2_3952 [Colletotrichum tanaceti]TKW54972.1 hypothetical protein CTA1_675 [Colletotrichum tanaceti]
MAPTKKTGVAKKQQVSATGSRGKTNLPKSKTNAPKGKTNAPKGKARDLVKNPKSAVPTQPQDTIVVGGQKRHVIAVENDSSDEGTIRPLKRRKGGKGPYPHDDYAVLEAPPRPRSGYGAQFAMKSTAHYTWGAPIQSPPLSRPKSQEKESEAKTVASLVKERGKKMSRSKKPSQPKPNRGSGGLLSMSAGLESQNGKKQFLFMKLPIEIRQKIYKEILVANNPIRVRQGWSAVYPRNRPLVETDILRVCRQVRNEAVNVLYGENTFLYLLREAAMRPATNSLGENEIVVQHPLLAEEHLSDYGGNSEDEYDDDDVLPMEGSIRDSEIEIDIRRYGHKFRKLMIVAEPNRTEKGYLLSMANAINVFRNLKPIRPRVHTLTIEITPIRDIHTGEISFLDFFEKTSDVTRALKGLPCQFIEILVNTGGGNQERIRLNMKYAANIRRAKRGQEDVWENDLVMQSYRSTQAGKAQHSLDRLSVMIKEVWEGPNGRFVSGLNSDESDDEDNDYF